MLTLEQFCELKSLNGQVIPATYLKDFNSTYLTLEKHKIIKRVPRRRGGFIVTIIYDTYDDYVEAFEAKVAELKAKTDTPWRKGFNLFRSNGNL